MNDKTHTEEQEEQLGKDHQGASGQRRVKSSDASGSSAEGPDAAERYHYHRDRGQGSENPEASKDLSRPQHDLTEDESEEKTP